MKTQRSFILALVVALSAQLFCQGAPRPAFEDLQRRTHGLRQEGFESIRGFGLGRSSATRAIAVPVVVPISSTEQHLLFWVEVDSGRVRFQLIAADDSLRASWISSRGEYSFVEHLPAGRYTVEIEPYAVVDGGALVAATGAYLPVETLPPNTEERPAIPNAGFWWPYLLWLPDQITSPCLIVVPNNTGFATEDIEKLRISASNDIRRFSLAAKRLGCPVLVPLLPRPARQGGDLYLHALTREALTTPEANSKRVDLQLLQMIADARALLLTRGVRHNAKVLLFGFSASGTFADRFAMLHPNDVAAVAAGGVSWPIAPVCEVKGERLPFPVGIADLDLLVGKSADIVGLRTVSWFLFRGAEDHNDSVDYADSFSQTDSEQIHRLFGTTQSARWAESERLYTDAGLNAEFRLYQGVGHSAAAAMDDVVTFFRKQLQEMSRWTPAKQRVAAPSGDMVRQSPER